MNNNYLNSFIIFKVCYLYIGNLANNTNRSTFFDLIENQELYEQKIILPIL
jgi:hypothetical protein